MSILLEQLNNNQISRVEFLSSLADTKSKNLKKILKKLPAEYVDDIDVLKVILKRSAILFKYIPEKHKNNMDLIKICAHRYCDLIDNLSDELKLNKKVVLACVKNKSFKVAKIPDSLMNDLEVVHHYINIHGYYYLNQFPEASNNFEFIKLYVSDNKNVFFYAGKTIQTNAEYVLEILKIDYSIIEMVGSCFDSDKEFLYRAQEMNPEKFAKSYFQKFFEMFKKEDALRDKLIDKPVSDNYTRKKI